MKKLYKIIFCLTAIALFSAVLQTGKAQVNIALTATATHSGGGTGTYAATNYNDNVIPAVGALPWGWVSATNTSGTAAWIQFQWTTQQSFNKMKFYNVLTTTRCLTGGTLQYWNGSTWVNAYNFSVSPQTEFEITFSPITSDRVRLVNMVISGSQVSNPNFREIQVFNSKPNDGGITKIYTLTCNGTQDVFANLTNFGNNRIDSARIFWQVNGASQTPVNYVKANPGDTIGSGGFKKINLGSFNFQANTNYTIKAWSSMPNGQNDSVPSNDTIVFSFRIYGIPNNPTANDQVLCGSQFPVLTGTGSSTLLNWYLKGDNSKVVAQGTSGQANVKVTPGQTYRFVAQAFNGGDDSLKNALTQTWSYTGGSPMDKGVYFDLLPSANVLLHKISPTITDLASAFAQYDVEVYYRNGTYLGSETNASKWISLGVTSITNTTNSNGTTPAIPVVLNITPVMLYKDSVYGFYVVVKNGGINLRNCAAQVATGSQQVTNYLTLRAGAISAGTFAASGLTQGYRIEANFHYKAGCVSDTVGANITVNPLPTGGALSQGSLFKGTFRSGTLNAPDVVASKDTITYSITPPTGYSNASYGTTWTILSTTASTVKGTPVPGTFIYTVSPGASGNGTVGFVPQLPFVDSVVILRVKLRDNGPYMCDSTLERHIIIAPRGVPRFTFFPQTVCAGEFIDFTNLSTVSSGSLTYKWYFGTGDSATTTNPLYKFTVPGSFPVKLVVTTVPYGYKTDTTIVIQVKEVPKASFTKVNACEGQNLVFTNTTTYSGGTISYTWDFGDGNTAATVNATHTYATPGSYNVTLKADGNGCFSEVTRRADQFPRPVAGFNSLNADCDSKQVQFTSTSTIQADGHIGYLWDFGDGTYGTIADPMHIYNTFGSKQVKLKVISEFGCRDSITNSFALKESPKAEFTAGIACSNDPVVFTNLSVEPVGAVTIYKWYFGDGDSSTVFSPSHQYASVGVKEVKLLVSSDNGCNAEYKKSVEVKLQPVASFSAENVCAGDPVKFINGSTVTGGNQLTYKWYMGDGNTYNGQSPTHVYSTATTTAFQVSLVATIPGGCSDSIMKPVNVFALPNCNFAIENKGNRYYSFTPAVLVGLTYQWLFGDGGSSVIMNPEYHYMALGEYKVTLVATTVDGHCVCSQTKDLGVNTGIEGQKPGLKAAVYPNPGAGKFTVTVSDNPSPALTMELYNAVGEKIREVNSGTSLNGSYVLDISDQANGVYLLKVDNGKEVLTLRITLAH